MKFMINKLKNVPLLADVDSEMISAITTTCIT